MSVPTRVDSQRSGATRGFGPCCAPPSSSSPPSAGEVDQAALALRWTARTRIESSSDGPDRLHDLDVLARSDLAAQDVVAIVA